MPLSEECKRLLNESLTGKNKFEEVWYYSNPKGSGFLKKKKVNNKK